MSSKKNQHKGKGKPTPAPPNPKNTDRSDEQKSTGQDHSNPIPILDQPDGDTNIATEDQKHDETTVPQEPTSQYQIISPLSDSETPQNTLQSQDTTTSSLKLGQIQDDTIKQRQLQSNVLKQRQFEVLLFESNLGKLDSLMATKPFNTSSSSLQPQTQSQLISAQLDPNDSTNDNSYQFSAEANPLLPPHQQQPTSIHHHQLRTPANAHTPQHSSPQLTRPSSASSSTSPPPARLLTSSASPHFTISTHHGELPHLMVLSPTGQKSQLIRQHHSNQSSQDHSSNLQQKQLQSYSAQSLQLEQSPHHLSNTSTKSTAIGPATTSSVSLWKEQLKYPELLPSQPPNATFQQITGGLATTTTTATNETVSNHNHHQQQNSLSFQAQANVQIPFGTRSIDGNSYSPAQTPNFTSVTTTLLPSSIKQTRQSDKQTSYNGQIGSPWLHKQTSIEVQYPDVTDLQHEQDRIAPHSNNTSQQQQRLQTTPSPSSRLRTCGEPGCQRLCVRVVDAGNDIGAGIDEYYSTASVQSGSVGYNEQVNCGSSIGPNQGLSREHVNGGGSSRYSVNTTSVLNESNSNAVTKNVNNPKTNTDHEISSQSRQSQLQPSSGPKSRISTISSTTSIAASNLSTTQRPLSYDRGGVYYKPGGNVDKPKKIWDGKNYKNNLFSWSEIALHNTEDDCWLVVFDEVYDVTTMVHEHPGGITTIVQFAGQNVDRHFNFHSKSSHAKWREHRVGIVDKQVPGAATTQLSRSKKQAQADAANNDLCSIM